MAKYVIVKEIPTRQFLIFGGMYGVYRKVLTACALAGIPIGVVSGWRGKEEQDDLEARGLSKAKFGSSPHNYGLAFDYCPTLPNGHFMDPSKVSDETWNRLGKIVEANGLTWGGSFKSIVDLDHAENTDWRALSQTDCPLLSEMPMDIEVIPA